MNADLNIRLAQSADPMDHPHPAVVTLALGRTGRPRKEIDPKFLEEVLRRRTQTGIAKGISLGPGQVSISSRTLRRRALELRLVDPGTPVMLRQEHDADTSRHSYVRNAASRGNMRSSNMTDEQLDGVMAEVLGNFPAFGRQMIEGEFRSRNLRIPNKRRRESYARVHGAPDPFTRRLIRKRVYNVAGPNSLWHHDGCHGTYTNLATTSF
jgi:hypothetical protein